MQWYRLADRSEGGLFDVRDSVLGAEEVVALLDFGRNRNTINVAHIMTSAMDKVYFTVTDMYHASGGGCCACSLGSLNACC